jgi:glycine C-acetyltransferase
VTALHENAAFFRHALVEAGLKPLEGDTPIVPIIVGETSLAIKISEMMLEAGVFVTGFGFPVVPQGHARIRCQVSASHSRADLDFAVAAFRKVGRAVGLLK